MKNRERFDVPGFKTTSFSPLLDPDMGILRTILQTMETKFLDRNASPHEIKSKVFALRGKHFLNLTHLVAIIIGISHKNIMRRPFRPNFRELFHPLIPFMFANALIANKV